MSQEDASYAIHKLKLFQNLRPGRDAEATARINGKVSMAIRALRGQATTDEKKLSSGDVSEIDRLRAEIQDNLHSDPAGNWERVKQIKALEGKSVQAAGPKIEPNYTPAVSPG